MTDISTATPLSGPGLTLLRSLSELYDFFHQFEALQSIEGAIAEANARLAKTKEDVEQGIADVHASLLSTRQSATQEVENIQQQRLANRDQMADLQRQADALMQRCADLDAQCSDKESKLQSLRAELARITNGLQG